jgi:hypothetical protein
MAQRFEEIVPFHPVVRLLYAAMLIVFLASMIQGGKGSPPLVVPILVGLGLLAIPLLFGRLAIVVDERNLTATWGYLNWPKKTIPLGKIERTEIIDYSPLRQFGGWGIRCGKIDGQTTSCYTLRGTRGLLLILNEDVRINWIRTRRFLLGTQEPEQLQQALLS